MCILDKGDLPAAVVTQWSSYDVVRWVRLPSRPAPRPPPRQPPRPPPRPPNTDLSPIIIPGYHIISTGHYASNHGGLVIYLNDIWNYDIITCDTDSHIWERQIIEITNPSNIARKKITIGNIYRPPYNLQDNIDTFMAEFNATLLQYHGNNSSTYFCGDYNIDLLKIPRIQMYEDYFDNILSAGYIPTITLPTRLSNNSTLIDNIFTNNVGNKLTACILNIHISDHQPVVLFSNHELPTVKTKYITITNNSDEAKAAFILSFENKHVLEQLVETKEDPNYNYEILERALTDSYTECFPKRVVKFNKKKHKKNAWISVGIIRSINHRNRLYKHLKQLKTDSFDYVIKKADFNRFRNVLKKTITHAKRLHFKRLFDQFRWEDGNNLTSNLFTLINNTCLLQHTKKNTPDIHAYSYKPYTEKKTKRKIDNNNNIKKKNKKKLEKIQKLCDMYND